MLHGHPPQTERTLQRSHTKNPLALCGEVPSLRPKKNKTPFQENCENCLESSTCESATSAESLQFDVSLQCSSVYVAWMYLGSSRETAAAMKQH